MSNSLEEVSKILDKQIHANELKLRILMTDGCTKFPRCSFCLNDFQPKPEIEKMKFLNSATAKTAIKQYSDSFRGKYPLQVYFSGGEPTMHLKLIDLMSFAKSLDCRVTLNTNGDFSESLEADLILFSDEIHFGTYEINKNHAEKVKRMEGTIQTVYKDIDESFIKFYSSYNIPIKVFQDFYDNSNDYVNFAKELIEKFPKSKLSFRYTGVQENRGPGCDDCNKKCCTLKAAWIFPDGGSSPCPQLHNRKLFYLKDSTEWSKYFDEVEQFHRKDN